MLSNDTFWAGMTMTCRSESMNTYLDGYVHSNTMLNEFVVQYDKSVHAWQEDEEKEEIQTINTTPNLSVTHSIEKVRFQEV